MPRRRKNKLRKNPVFLAALPFATKAAIVVGTMVAGGIGASYWNAEVGELSQKDLYAVAKQWEEKYKSIQNGTFNMSEVNIAPNAIINPPTSAKQANLQGAWRLMQGAMLVGLPDGDSLLKAAENMYNKSVWSSNSTLQPNDPKIQQPLQSAINSLQEYYGFTSSLISALSKNANVQNIQSQQNWESENSAENVFENTMKDTWTDTTMFAQVFAGLFTGKKPPKLTDKQWRRARIIGYTMLGMGTTAYIVTKFSPLIEVYAKKKMKELEDDDE